MKRLVLALLLVGCGEPCPEVSDYGVQWVNEVADAFVQTGYPRPNVPVTLCGPYHGPCPDWLRHNCGMWRSSDGCEEVAVVVDLASRPECHPVGDLAHEWLHALGYDHGNEMDKTEMTIKTMWATHNIWKGD